MLKALTLYATDRIVRTTSSLNRGSGVHPEGLTLKGIGHHILPNYISPLFHQAIVEADSVLFEDIYAKVVKLEFLIVLLLTAFRPKDRIRMQSLLNKADKELLLDIICRFDDEQKSLYERYQKVLADTQ